LACYKQMAHADDGTGTSLGGSGAPNPPPVPPNLAEAMVALVNATVENARLLREMTQHNQNVPQGNRGRYNNRNETTYVDFTNTRPQYSPEQMNLWKWMTGSVPWSKSLTSLTTQNTRSQYL
jgi:hypothetical protein